MIPEKMLENKKIVAGQKINTFIMSGLYLKIVSVSFSISAIILITIAIATPNGITYYEDLMFIKIFEILLSSVAVLYLLHDLLTSLIQRENR